MQVTEQSPASTTELVAHRRPAVERWLSWSGVIPLPVFLLLHISRELVLSRATDVTDLLRPAPSGVAIATLVLLVWIPLAVHAGLGLWLVLSGAGASVAGPDVPAPARRVSRLTSLLALAFLAYHAREYPLATLLGEADARDAGLRLAARLSGTSYGVPLRGAAYLLGLAATVAHAGLGVHRALLREGRLTSGAARRVSARACAAAAALLFGLGAATVIRVATGALLH